MIYPEQNWNWLKGQKLKSVGPQWGQALETAN